MPQANNKDMMARISEVLSFLIRNWIFLLAAAILGAAAGYFGIRNKKPSYTASISFVLSTDAKTNNLASITSQLGFDALSSSPDNIFSGDNIIELFKSPHLIGASLQTLIDSTSQQTLLNFIAQKTYPDSYKSLGPFSRIPGSYNARQNKLYRRIILDVSKSFLVFKKDKKLLFYIISATSVDPDIAYYTAKYVLNQTSDNFIEIKTRVAANSVSLLRHEADTIARQLGSIYNSTAETIDRTYNLNPSLTIQRSGSMFNQAKAMAYSAAYTEVMRNLEIAKINLQKETPLYRIIDEPELPLDPIMPRKKLYILLTSSAGLLLMAAMLTIDYLYKR